MAKLVFSRSTAFQVLMPITVNLSGFCSLRTSSGPPELPASTCAVCCIKGSSLLWVSDSIRALAFDTMPCPSCHEGFSASAGNPAVNTVVPSVMALSVISRVGTCAPWGRAMKAMSKSSCTPMTGQSANRLELLSGRENSMSTHSACSTTWRLVMMYSRLSCLLR